MQPLYRGMDREALDAGYNNSEAVADSSRIIEGWNARSDALAAKYPQHLDLRYGARERNRIDFFPAAKPDAPVLAFIHGGYWQMRAKESFRFVAAGPLARGISVANVAYTLAPDASLPQIVDEIDAALTWIADNAGRFGGDPARLFVSGWSAGGHLAAMSLGHASVRGGLAISGLFDLEPVRLCYVNEKLRLEERDVGRMSPLANIPSTSPPFMLAYGTAELPELQRQSREYAEARARAGLPGGVSALEGHNHFTILEELASAEGALTRLVRDLVIPA